MQKEHSQEWFAKQEARLQEPINNTKRYYMRRGFALLAAFPTIVCPIIGIIELVRVNKYINTIISQIDVGMINGRTTTNDGTPGSGKTFSGSNTAYYLAQKCYNELQEDYFMQREMYPQWVRDGDTDKIAAFTALEESYNFFKEQEDKYIPCLVSSIPLREYGTGRMSYVLTPEALLQIDRLPEHVVIFNDESGDLFGADKSKTASPDAVDFWRFIRHFLDAMCVNTNQDGGQNMIAIRRSTDYVNHIYGQQHLMPPVMLLKRIERRKRRFFKKMSKGKLSPPEQEYYGQELYYLKRYAATIGFRKVKHQLCSSKGEVVSGIEEMIFPAIGGVEYDNRCFRNLYKCKDKAIELKGWDKLVVDERDRDEYDGKITGAA